MQLTQHPQYRTYVRDRETDQRCREAVAAWRASQEPIVVERCSLRWTFERAQTFARDLSYLAQEYNRILWERFPYCRQCGGTCCRVDASQVDVRDSILLALLGQSLPELPAEIEATAQDCIYRTSEGCAWPVEWKPLTCWVYYCLGQSGQQGHQPWEPIDPSDERYAPIVERLTWVVLDFLPDALRRYEEAWNDPLDVYLGDPFDFADAVSDALFLVLVAPFDDRYPMIDE
jgi:hypothetical protein